MHKYIHIDARTQLNTLILYILTNTFTQKTNALPTQRQTNIYANKYADTETTISISKHKPMSQIYLLQPDAGPLLERTFSSMCRQNIM